jgi:phosphomethylpyrimidine synthase
VRQPEILLDEDHAGRPRDYATTLNDPASVGMSVSSVLEHGMAQMSPKFKEMGGQVYLDAEKVNESNRV